MPYFSSQTTKTKISVDKSYDEHTLGIEKQKTNLQDVRDHQDERSSSENCLEEIAKAIAISMLDHAPLYHSELLTAAPAEVKIRPAMDSGAVDNVICEGDLPAGVEPDGRPERHFVGASNEHIECQGACDSLLSGAHGQVACKWQVADVARPLHSVSKTTGPAEGPGLHDVLFNNRLAVVVPPGIVDKILEHITPLLQYDRQGGLYVAELTMSSFARQGRQQ